MKKCLIINKKLLLLLTIVISLFVITVPSNAVYIDMDAYKICVTEVSIAPGFWSSATLSSNCHWRGAHDDWTVSSGYKTIHSFDRAGTFTPSTSIKLNPSAYSYRDYDYGRYDNSRKPVKVSCKMYIRELVDPIKDIWLYKTYTASAYFAPRYSYADYSIQVKSSVNPMIVATFHFRIYRYN